MTEKRTSTGIGRTTGQPRESTQHLMLNYADEYQSNSTQLQPIRKPPDTKSTSGGVGGRGL